jgi:hypothetical protein
MALFSSWSWSLASVKSAENQSFGDEGASIPIVNAFWMKLAVTVSFSALVSESRDAFTLAPM